MKKNNPCPWKKSNEMIDFNNQTPKNAFRKKITFNLCLNLSEFRKTCNIIKYKNKNKFGRGD